MTEMNFEITGPNMTLVADRAVERAIAAVSEQAFKDCNFYCKQDTGALIESSLIHTSGKEGPAKKSL